MKKLLYSLVAIALFASCKDKEEESAKVLQEELTAVSVVSPQLTSMLDEITASGVLSSKTELKLAFKTGGMIKRIHFKEGQTVHAGQLLAELDMSEIDASVNQAKLGFQKAERDLERVKNMLADEVATKTNLDDATTGYNLARESVETATFNQRLSKIYAPQAGIILLKIAEQGELITPFAPALILGTGGNSFSVKVGLTDRDIVRLRIGNTAEVSLDAYPGEVFPAKITEIAQTVNPATGTYVTELTINGKGKKLISGFVAKAKINPPGEKTILTIPAAALLEAEGQKAFVYVLNGETVDKKEVVLGAILANKVEVKTGLTVSDKVVDLGANFLNQGQKVKVVN